MIEFLKKKRDANVRNHTMIEKEWIPKTVDVSNLRIGLNRKHVEKGTSCQKG